MSARRVIVVVTLAVLGLGIATAASTSAEQRSSRQYAPLTRYSLVHGCYAVSTGGRRLGPFTMQAAALGQYLLYGVNGDYLGPGLTQVSTPDNSTIWRVDSGGGGRFRMTNLGTGSVVPVAFSPASGCTAYPEAQVGATGNPSGGAAPGAAVQGTMEGHAHVSAFELFGGDWHCGRPWSPFGAPYALPADCSQYQQGSNGGWQTLIDYGAPTRPSDMHGWPTFREWPSPTALAEEGDYWTAIERAWKSGLRLMVTNIVDNEALCSVMTTRHLPCNDMASVHTQSHDLFALQDYIDAQSGGPGKGWFRIVTDPFQARRMINQGKLAVIEGIEVSHIFNCGEHGGAPECGTAEVDAGLNEVRKLGVRTFFPIHEFDNAFGGTKMIAGDTGVIVNAGNRLETGSFWTVEPCPATQQDAEQINASPGDPVGQLLNGPFSSLLGGNPLPAYPSGPQCNVHGLTDLGSYLIKQMAKQHFIIQLDHMSSKTATAALGVAESVHYPGVVSAHCCGSYQLNGRIYRLGGFVNPQKDAAKAFVSVYGTDKAERSRPYYFGFGYGSDMNGLSAQPGPDPGVQVTYPFKSVDGRVTFTRERWGDRVFDLNTDGLANYGLYADWLQSVRQAGGPAVTRDMFRGAEAFLETWERADGVPTARCPRGSVTPAGLGKLRLGASFASVLRGAGQPSSRPGRSYRYCSAAGVFGPAGNLVLISSTARGAGAGGARVGGVVPRGAKQLAPGISVSSDRHFVYGVRGGRIRYAAVVSGSELGDLSLLRSDLHAAGL